MLKGVSKEALFFCACYDCNCPPQDIHVVEVPIEHFSGVSVERYCNSDCNRGRLGCDGERPRNSRLEKRLEA